MDVHNNMGDLWRAQGAAGRHQAQRCYATALRLDQTYAPAWRGLGDLLREEGDHSQAVSCYQARPLGCTRAQPGRVPSSSVHWGHNAPAGVESTSPATLRRMLQCVR